MHESELLWRRHHEVAPYPDDVLPVPELIEGTAFFPGGRGVWQWEADSAPPPPLPVGGIMILGHDFHSEESYRKSLARGHESRSQPTWRALLQLLEAARIHPLYCFFTNLYMGLRRGSVTTGRFPGADEPAFVDRCLSFLAVQLSVFQPKIILTLGSHVPQLLGRVTPDLEDWRSAMTFQDLDSRRPFRPIVRFDTPEGVVQSAVVTLTHPSHRRLNVSRRRYMNEAGEVAELRMLADSCAILPVFDSRPAGL